MAVGLGFLGRGRGRVAYGYGALHIAGAALAGAASGGLLGLIGDALGLSGWRSVLIALGIAAAIYWGSRPTPPPIGRQRQVRRRWSPGTPLAWVYVVWGGMLGCGFYTPVYQSVFLLLTSAQLTAGWQLGLISGAIFGAMRQLTALYPVHAGFAPERTMNLLATLRPHAYRGNFALIALGGAALLITAWLAR